MRVLDDNSRGSPRRLTDVEKDIEFIAGDIRDAARGRSARRKAWTRCTTSPSSTARNFSTAQPELVLDVGVRGMVNVIDACRKHNVGTLVLASSSEVYQTPPTGADRRERAAGRARSAQPALFLRRRQDHQRTDGDQLRPQISSSAC